MGRDTTIISPDSDPRKTMQRAEEITLYLLKHLIAYGKMTLYLLQYTNRRVKLESPRGHLIQVYRCAPLAKVLEDY